MGIGQWFRDRAALRAARRRLAVVKGAAALQESRNPCPTCDASLDGPHAPDCEWVASFPSRYELVDRPDLGTGVAELRGTD